MTWLLFASLTAIFESFKDVVSKVSLETVDEYIVSFCLISFQLPLLFLVLLTNPLPEIKPNFLPALFSCSILNLFSFLMYVKAIRLADLSLTVPLITLSTLFFLITSPVIVHEYPSPINALGMGIIVFGSYILNFNQTKQGFFAPLKFMWKEKGCQLMLFVALIWSVTANIDKVGVLNSSPVFWLSCHYSFIALGMVPIVWHKSADKLHQIRLYFPSLFAMGLFGAIAVLFQMRALELTLVARVISVKRISTMLTVIWGFVIFHEKNFRERILGAAIMLVGVFLVLR
jgi:drug/metabolite transporter (DMT)-like permease